MQPAKITFRDNGRLITDSLLGTFQHTGIKRRADVGEYYLGNRGQRVCYAKEKTNETVEILRKVQT